MESAFFIDKHLIRDLQKDVKKRASLQEKERGHIKKFEQQVDSKFQSTDLKIIINNKKRYLRKRCLCLLRIAFFLSILYVIFWRNALVNDIISIFSLSISITEDDISKKIANNIYIKK